MRTHSFMLLAALALSSRAMAQPPQTPSTASSPPAQAAPAGAEGGLFGPFRGTLDIGGLFTTTDGDEARYQRYLDLRDGL